MTAPRTAIALEFDPPALKHSPLIPAKAGIQYFAKNWVPAFAGTSGRMIQSYWITL